MLKMSERASKIAFCRLFRPQPQIRPRRESHHLVMTNRRGKRKRKKRKKCRTNSDDDQTEMITSFGAFDKVTARHLIAFVGFSCIGLARARGHDDNVRSAANSMFY